MSVANLPGRFTVLGQLNWLPRWFSWRGFSDKLLTGVCPEGICTVGSGIILWRSVVFQACLSEDVVLKIASASL